MAAKRKVKAAGRLALSGVDGLSVRGRKKVGAWLRQVAAHVERRGDQYGRRLTASLELR